MRKLFAAAAATLFVSAVTPAFASSQGTVVLNDGRAFVITGRCHTVLVGGSGYCVNRGDRPVRL